MKRITHILFSTALIATTMVSGAQASTSPKVGAVCSKPGLVQQVGSTTFVCATVSSKSVWIVAGTKAAAPAKAPAAKAPVKTAATAPTQTEAPKATCTSGIGTKLFPTMTTEQNGLSVLRLTNPTACTISYSLTGSVICIHYKNMREPISAMANGTLYANQSVLLYPSQAFPVANQTCQQMQKASGAGPEYGAGILGFGNSGFQGSITGISN